MSQTYNLTITWTDREPLVIEGATYVDYRGAMLCVETNNYDAPSYDLEVPRSVTQFFPITDMVSVEMETHNADRPF